MRLSLVFHDAATPEIYTLSLHDALPIYENCNHIPNLVFAGFPFPLKPGGVPCTEDSAEMGSRSEEHTSELQSLRHLVCRLLLEKKKKAKNRTGSIVLDSQSYRLCS